MKTILKILLTISILTSFSSNADWFNRSTFNDSTGISILHISEMNNDTKISCNILPNGKMEQPIMIRLSSLAGKEIEEGTKDISWYTKTTKGTSKLDVTEIAAVGLIDNKLINAMRTNNEITFLFYSRVNNKSYLIKKDLTGFKKSYDLIFDNCGKNKVLYEWQLEKVIPANQSEIVFYRNRTYDKATLTCLGKTKTFYPSFNNDKIPQEAIGKNNNINRFMWDLSGNMGAGNSYMSTSYGKDITTALTLGMQLKESFFDNVTDDDHFNIYYRYKSNKFTSSVSLNGFKRAKEKLDIICKE